MIWTSGQYRDAPLLLTKIKYYENKTFIIIYYNYKTNNLPYSQQVFIILLISLLTIILTSIFNRVILNLTLQICLFLTTLIPLIYFKKLIHFKTWNKKEFID